MKKNKYEITQIKVSDITDMSFIKYYQNINNLCKTKFIPYPKTYSNFKNYSNVWFFNYIRLRQYKKLNSSLIESMSLSIIKNMVI